MAERGFKIPTTHVGSLPEPAGRDGHAADADLKAVVADIVARQRGIGLDVINEGEFTKGGDWLSYIENRFEGFDPRPASAGKPLLLQGRDREEFSDFYRYASERGTLYYGADTRIRSSRPHYVCTRPVAYKGQAALAHEIGILRAVTAPENVFLTTTAPASLEPYRENEFYKTEEEFVFALAEAMRVEYEAIAQAGFLVQVDDAWLAALWDRIGIAMGLDAYRRRCFARVEALNHALRNVPEAQVRYHMCWGSWHGPHVHDLEMVHLVDVMLKVKARYYLIEAANARHEHEYAVWENVKLPPGKVVVPGVVTHSTDIIEHPELVAQRLVRFAERVGRDNVMAGTDCGFGGRTHPQIAWAKLQALVNGAALASRALA
jgi:5-methyltetrahydropteroyltriglutamate--homocysteine methyltransferase